MLNNLFLAAATAAVLFGTLFPLIRQALSGDAVSVGPPYFNRTFAPLMAAVLLILPIAPLMPWKRADLKRHAKIQQLWVAAGLAVAAAVLSFALARPGQAVTALGLGLASGRSPGRPNWSSAFVTAAPGRARSGEAFLNCRAGPGA